MRETRISIQITHSYENAAENASLSIQNENFSIKTIFPSNFLNSSMEKFR